MIGEESELLSSKPLACTSVGEEMKYLKILEVIGATLTIVGSFLPWEITGGIIGANIYGVKVDFVYFKYWFRGILRNFPVYDYGGVVVILLTLATVILTFKRPRFIKEPNLWNLIIAATLMVSSLCYLGRGVAHLYEARYFAELPTITTGLNLVLLGSAILLWKAGIAYHQTMQQ